jgi:diguanylate cyclase (GGDEF)-like protein
LKIERSSSVRGARPVAATAYARAAENVSPANPISGVAASVLGIPENEFTPRVRDAIMNLMGEVDTLRRELQQTRTRLETVEKEADQDHLLPVLNRRAFVRELMRYIAFTDRYGTPASLLFFDLDGFKQTNDTYGHAGGDAALAHFAETLLQNVRDSDCVGRLGGDEFGVLLSHATQEQATKKADLLAESLRKTPIAWNGKSITVQFSYGAFELKSGEKAETAMARADEAMYVHKRSAAR